MDHSTSTENAQPWWADVAHLRGDASPTAATTVTAPPAEDPFPLPERSRERDTAPARAERSHTRTRAAARSSRRPERERTDWFEKEARTAGRRSTPRQDPSRPRRPRATLVDVSPDHALLHRAPQVRRAPGERPTVTITGRPEAALPPRVSDPRPVRARRTRAGASSLVSSPDRMILWAVALGLLMILASIGTANADAATTLTLLP